MTEQISTTSNNLRESVFGGRDINLKIMSPRERGIVLDQVVGIMKEATRNADMGYITLGFAWNSIIKNKMYKYYGDHIKNANAFIKELDLGHSRRQLDKYGQVAMLFGEVLAGRHIGIKKLETIAPVCVGPNPEPSTEAWVEKAVSLPQSALEDEVREHQGKTPKDVCGHPTDKVEIWSRCSVCSKWLERVRSS